MVEWMREDFRGEIQHGSTTLVVISIERVYNTMRSQESVEK